MIPLPASLYDISGLFGVTVFLGSYAALQIGLVRGSGYLYASLNMVGAGFTLVSLTQAFNLSAALLQICWIAISVIGILRTFLLTRGIRFDREEARLLEHKFPTLPKIAARRLFKAGEWIDAPAGTRLMQEGEAHGVLIYLADGSARICAQGVQVGTATQGSFLGEMTVLEGTPATASVTLQEPARLFRVSAAQLNRIGQRDQDFKLQLENALSRDVRLKLVAANSRLKQYVDTDAQASEAAP